VGLLRNIAVSYYRYDTENPATNWDVLAIEKYVREV